MAAGIGKRLQPLTNKIPKPLIKINGEVSILERIIESLRENQIRDIVITTGPFEEKIKKLVKEKFPELNVSYVYNPDYAQTNYIYSLWLAKEATQNTDIVLIHGDMVYDFKLMERIINEDKSCVLVKENGDLPQKDFKARIENGLITKIGVDVFGKETRACMPLYKLTESDYKEWLKEIEKFIKENKLQFYAEDAFNRVSDKIKLYPLYYNDNLCMEVDNFDDLEKARELLKFSK